MPKICRLMLYIIAGLGALRGAYFLLYTSYQFASPIETHPLESEMVHLSWRVQSGLSLYPQWKTYPHVSNFFAPVYFWCIGGLGRAFDANLQDLFLIGRAITVALNLLTTFILSAFLYRRYGGLAALLGAIISLGASPLHGFAVMVRPDVMADFLGITGFVLTIQHRRSLLLLGGALLVAACLTKQTAGMYLLASLVASWLQPQSGRSSWLLTAWTATLLIITIAAIQLYEPNSLRCWVEEGATPFLLRQWLSAFQQLLDSSPDLLLISVVGVVAWIRSRPREIDLAILAIVVVTVSLVTSAKLGSDLNYYLGLRSVEALALGKLWHSAAALEGRRAFMAAAVFLLIAVSMFPSVRYAETQSLHKREQAAFFATARGRAMLEQYNHVLQLGDNPDRQILTDSGMLALRQRERAAFVDPWLFRMLVQSGRIKPAVIEERIRLRKYDAVVLTSDVDNPTFRYEDYIFGLPEPLVRKIREHYELVDKSAGLFIYHPVRAPP